MKTLFIILFAFAVTSCCKKETINLTNSRIKIIEYNGKLCIFSIDGVEYIKNYNGGIYPLIKNK